MDLPFTATQAKTKIDYLFTTFWPVMEGVTLRYGDCLSQLVAILAIVNDPHLTHDDRLARLDRLSGIGPTIASGLLWSFFPEDCVPFDKHTMGYCAIDWKVISSHRITDGTYFEKCAAIVARLGSHDPVFSTIDDLVRYAADNRSMEVSPI
jgi:hypothetical protein